MTNLCSCSVKSLFYYFFFFLKVILIAYFINPSAVLHLLTLLKFKNHSWQLLSLHTNCLIVANWLLFFASVISSKERKTNVSSDIYDSIFSVISLAIVSIKSFCVAGDVYLKNFEIVKWLSVIGSYLANSIKSSLYTHLFLDSTDSSFALNAHSCFFRNSRTLIELFKIFQFSFTFSLCLLSAIFFSFGNSVHDEFFESQMFVTSQTNVWLIFVVFIKLLSNTVEPHYLDNVFSCHSAYHVSFSKSWFFVYDF